MPKPIHRNRDPRNSRSAVQRDGTAENIGMRGENRRSSAGHRNEDPTKKEHAQTYTEASLGRACVGETNERPTAPFSTLRRDLHQIFFGRLDHLPSPIVPTVLARTMHHLRVAAVITFHQLGRLQLVVVRGSTLPRAGLRMSSLRYSHNSFPVRESTSGW